jgi:hypothetical protein
VACDGSHCCSNFTPGLPPRLFLLTISLTFTRKLFIYVFLSNLHIFPSRVTQYSKTQKYRPLLQFLFSLCVNLLELSTIYLFIYESRLYVFYTQGFYTFPHIYQLTIQQLTSFTSFQPKDGNTKLYCRFDIYFILHFPYMISFSQFY